MAAACCGLRRRRANNNNAGGGGGSNSSGKYKHQQQQQQNQQQRRSSSSAAAAAAAAASECFAKLHTVLSLPELESAATEILGDLLTCRDLRFHYNEDSPLVKACSGLSFRSVTFANGYLKSLTSSRDVSHLDAASMQQSEAVQLFGSAPSGHQGVALPVREVSSAASASPASSAASAATHCLVTFVAPEVTDQQRMTLEAFKRQLETTCTRLVRLASLGFPATSFSSSSGPGSKAPAVVQQQQLQSSLPSGSNGTEESSCDGAGATTLARRDSQMHPILGLCAELYDQDSGNLQLKVINYLKSRISCETGFLLLVSQDRAHVFCQVVGDAILSEEVHIGVGIDYSKHQLPANKGVNTETTYYLND